MSLLRDKDTQSLSLSHTHSTSKIHGMDLKNEK